MKQERERMKEISESNRYYASMLLKIKSYVCQKSIVDFNIRFHVEILKKTFS